MSDDQDTLLISGHLNVVVLVKARMGTVLQASRIRIGELEINGMWGGYQGPGTKTVTPSEAHAKITCRLAPNQDPAGITAKIIRHLEAHLPPGVRLAVSPGAHAAQPYRIAPNHIGLRVAEAALAETFGVQPLTVRMGGAVPVCAVFKRVRGVDTVFFSFSTADEDFHAPNEFFRIHRLHEGLEAWARYWELLGERVTG